MRLLLLFSLCFPLPAPAQNYITNGSFEREPPRRAGVWKIDATPCRFSKASDIFVTNAQGWNTFNVMTPDLLVLDSARGCPQLPLPHKGNRMVGLIMYHPFQDGQFSFDYHELLQGSFGKPLEKGKTYLISFWVRSDDSLGVRHLSEVFGRTTGIRPVHCGNFGFYFSTSPINPRENFMVSQLDFAVRPQVNLETIVDTRDEWRQYQFTFRAEQPYRYFLFGNFFSDAVTPIDMKEDERMALDDQNTRREFWQKTKRIAYYLFDDFRVELDTAGALEKALRDEHLYTFSEALLFDSGKADLKPGAAAELENLIRVLQKNSGMRIEIGGHTDNVGGSAANQALSEQRARVVYDYLIQHQVTAARIAWRGYGETAPLVANATDADRRRNRRVEIKVRAQ